MTNSNLLKVSRAVNGDDWFIERIKTACILQGVDYSERLAMQVAHAVVDDIQVDAELTVTTTAVTDQAIETALTVLTSTPET